MQAERQTPSPRQRLRAGEIGIIIANLFVCAPLCASFLSDPTYNIDVVRQKLEQQDWNWPRDIFSLCLIGTGLWTGLSILLICSRKRDAAGITQWLSATTFLTSVALFAWRMFQSRFEYMDLLGIPQEFLLIPLALVPALFVWFGWLLRRMDA